MSFNDLTHSDERSAIATLEGILRAYENQYGDSKEQMLHEDPFVGETSRLLREMTEGLRFYLGH